MKKMNLWILAILSLLIVGCQNEKNSIQPQKCQLKDLEGRWIWIAEDGKLVESEKITIGIITADGTETYWKIKDGKWVKNEWPISVKDGIVSFEDIGDNYVVSLDRRSLVVESVKNKKRNTAKRVLSTDNRHVQGTWMSDTLYVGNGGYILDFEITLGDTSYVLSHKNGDTIQGRYWIFDDFMVYNSTRCGTMRLNIEMSQSGPIMTSSVIESDGSITKNTLHKKALKTFTNDDVVGTWLTTTINGQDIPLNQATICYAADNSGRSTISSIEENKWVTKDVVYTLDNNVMTRTIENKTDQATILYFDENTIVWMNHSDGNIITRKKIGNPNDGKDRMIGLWMTESPFLDKYNMEVIRSYYLYNPNDTLYSIHVYANDSIRLDTMTYIIYGDYFICERENYCNLFGPIVFRFDAERKQLCRTIPNQDKFGNTQLDTYYKRDLMTDLSGSWIFVEKNKKRLSTYDCIVASFDEKTGKNLHIFFNDSTEKEKIDDYSIVGNRILYDDPNNPYDEIIKVDDRQLVLRTWDGDYYMAYRITQNSLPQQIIGEWSCTNFTDNGTRSLTHTFNKGGLVSFKGSNDDIGYGTYFLFGRLLVMHGINNNLILWVIKDGKIENNTMTLVRTIDEEGTMLENILTKQQ